MNENTKSCTYIGTNGETCEELAVDKRLCFWHSPATDKRGDDIKQRLEILARSGRSMEGFKLQRADLSGINLVKPGSSKGYNLSYADLYRANLEKAHLFALDLTGARLMKANLTRANLHCVNLSQANLLGIEIDHAKLEMIKLGKQLVQEIEAREAIDVGDYESATEFYLQSEEIYRNLRSTCTRQGLFEHAGDYFHKEMVMRRKQKAFFDPARFMSLTIDVFCGYGEKPLRVIIFSLLLISIFSLGYGLAGLEDKGELIALRAEHTFRENLDILFNCIYFSVVTFTTLGFGDIVPIGLTRFLAAAQAFIGSFTMALFVVVFVNKVTR